MVRTSRAQARATSLTVTRLSELNIADTNATVDRADVVIHNVVATASFGVDVDLEKLAWFCYGEYNPRTFRAVKLRLTTPRYRITKHHTLVLYPKLKGFHNRSTALIFSSGKVVCTGGASEVRRLRFV